MSYPGASPVLGIDLGTYNSAAAVLLDDRPVLLRPEEGATDQGACFPSFVEFDERTHPRRFTYVEEIMVTDVVTTTPDASALEAARLMSSNRIHRLPVLRDGRLVGIISSFDLMRCFAGGQPAK